MTKKLSETLNNMPNKNIILDLSRNDSLKVNWQEEIMSLNNNDDFLAAINCDSKNLIKQKSLES